MFMVIILDEKQFKKNLNIVLFLCIVITIGVIHDLINKNNSINLYLVIIVIICTLIILIGRITLNRWFP